MSYVIATITFATMRRTLCACAGQFVMLYDAHTAMTRHKR